jgi:hypothetical protein
MTTWFAGDELDAAALEAQFNSRPRYNGTFSGSIANNSTTTITPTTVTAVGGITVATSTITVPSGGEYEIGIWLRWASQSTAAGFRVARFNVSGSDRGFFAVPAASINGTNITSGGVSRLNLLAGDTIVFQAYQNSGGALSLTGDAHCWIDRIVQ